MRAPRSLTLRKETLAELETTELASVVGGPDSPLSNQVCLVRPTEQNRCHSLLDGCTYNC